MNDPMNTFILFNELGRERVSFIYIECKRKRVQFLNELFKRRNNKGEVHLKFKILEFMLIVSKNFNYFYLTEHFSKEILYCYDFKFFIFFKTISIFKYMLRSRIIFKVLAYIDTYKSNEWLIHYRQST